MTEWGFSSCRQIDLVCVEVPGLGQEDIPQGLKPHFRGELERAKAKALAYLEAKYLLKQAAISQSYKAKGLAYLRGKYLLKQAGD